MNKRAFWIGIITLGIILSGAIIYTYISQKEVDQKKTITKDNFNLEYTYQGNNQWVYTVTGTLPTPCYSVATEALVMESYPEQVQIKIKIQEQPTEGVCSTVIQEYSYDGTFNASNRATISLVVE